MSTATATKFLVTAPLVIARAQDGKMHHAYYGTVLHFLDDEQREHFLRKGLVEEIKPGYPAEQPAPLDALLDKPKKVAPKEEWVNFGVSKGNDRAELESLTKDELVDLLSDF